MNSSPKDPVNLAHGPIDAITTSSAIHIDGIAPLGLLQLIHALLREIVLHLGDVFFGKKSAHGDMFK